MFKEEKGFGVPAAIVVAGAIIAIALIFTGNKEGASDYGKINTDSEEGGTSLLAIVKELGIKEKNFEKCVSKDETLDKVKEDVSGISSIASQPGFGTPYNVVIDTKTGATIPVVGAQPFENMEKLINLILSDDPSVSDISVDLTIPEITLEGDHTRGDLGARIQVVEYSDFECPFCGRFHDTMKQVMSKYEESGDVAWTYRHFPLDQIHPQATPLALASECVADLGGNDKFWEFSDTMFGK